MPEPRLVVAVGACAISGGVFAGTYAAGTASPECCRSSVHPRLPASARGPDPRSPARHGPDGTVPTGARLTRAHGRILVPPRRPAARCMARPRIDRSMPQTRLLAATLLVATLCLPAGPTAAGVMASPAASPAPAVVPLDPELGASLWYQVVTGEDGRAALYLGRLADAPTYRLIEAPAPLRAIAVPSSYGPRAVLAWWREDGWSVVQEAFDDGELLPVLRNRPPISALALSPDGRWLFWATARPDGTSSGVWRRHLSLCVPSGGTRRTRPGRGRGHRLPFEDQGGGMVAVRTRPGGHRGPRRPRERRGPRPARDARRSRRGCAGRGPRGGAEDRGRADHRPARAPGPGGGLGVHRVGTGRHMAAGRARRRARMGGPDAGRGASRCR